MSFSKVFLFAGNKILPFVGLPILIWLWVRQGGVAFTFLVLGLPLVFGYVVPGIGTNVLKMWRFRDRWLVGDYFIHHGFIYASTMGFVMYFSFFPPAPNDWVTSLGNMARCACILGFVLWIHDLIAMREGMLEVYTESWKQGASPEVVAAHYAPLCFSLLGASYAGAVSFGYQTLVLDKNIDSLWWLFPLGLVVMSVAISLPFLAWIKEIIREKMQASSKTS